MRDGRADSDTAPLDFESTLDRTPGENVAALLRAMPADWDIHDAEDYALREIRGAGPTLVQRVAHNGGLHDGDATAAADTDDEDADIAVTSYPAADFMGDETT